MTNATDASPAGGTTLCYPDGLKSCFACCPPIRPAGYEHIDYRIIIQRILRENTRAFDRRSGDVSPIVGFSCWALGYLDRECRLVGCLLHPAGHDGVDLRYRVDYGDKCRREKCPQAAVFERLSPGSQRFWLKLTKGLDSFAYSSRRMNPLFSLLDWGAEAMEAVACEVTEEIGSLEDLCERLPFFRTALTPRAHGYFLKRALDHAGTDPLKRVDFLDRFEDFVRFAAERVRAGLDSADEATPFIHRLPLDRQFLDFIRLLGGKRRMGLEKAIAIKKMIDAAFEKILCDGSAAFIASRGNTILG